MKKIIIITIGIVIVIAILASTHVSTHSRPHIMVKIVPEVQVSGKVITEGWGTTPTSVDFLSDYDQPFSTAVKDGTYSILLGDHHAYSVTVHYSIGFGIIDGACNADPLLVYVNSSSLKYDFYC